MNSVRCRKTVKLTLCFLLIAALSICVLGGAPEESGIKPLTFARAASISEMEGQINEYESEKNALEDKISALEDDIAEQDAYLSTIDSYIATVEGKIRACESLLDTYQEEIDDMNEEIAEKEKELEASKELFKRRLRAIAMSETGSDINFLMGADEYANYLSMEQFTENMAKYDNILMLKIEKSVKEIDGKIAKQNKAIKKQEKIKKELASERAELQTKQSEATAVRNEIKSKEMTLEEELAELDANIAALEQKVAAAYEAARQQALNESINYDGNGFAWPLPGYRTITSYFGMRYDPYFLCYRMHNGIDISGGGIAGKPIVATAGGQVIASMGTWESGGYGNYVIISHGYVNGQLITSHYAHMMDGTRASVGQTVNQGDVIGYVGTTGASTGYHLHFEMRADNVPVDPLAYVN